MTNENKIPHSIHIVQNTSDLFSLQSVQLYRVGQKCKPDNFCNNFVYCQPIVIILACIHCRKFATREYVVSPPNVVWVTTLPCKILTTTFFTFSIHCCKKDQLFTSVVIIANFCGITFTRIIPDEYYLFSSNGYAFAAVWSIAMAADTTT